jgi:hypothetical protein
LKSPIAKTAHRQDFGGAAPGSTVSRAAKYCAGCAVMKLCDGFALFRREAAIKGLAPVRHFDEKLRRLEPLAASTGQIAA